VDFILGILSCLIPIIWWRVTARSDVLILPWAGLKKPEVSSRRSFWLLVAFAALLVILTPMAMFSFMPGLYLPNMDSSQIASWIILSSLIRIPTGLAIAFAEELFFRGFMGKRLINKIGFAAGNAIQAVAFGLFSFVYVVFTSGLSVIALAVVGSLFRGAFGWLAGYITEKQAGGSIIPSWILNGFFNAFSFAIIILLAALF